MSASPGNNEYLKSESSILLFSGDGKKQIAALVIEKQELPEVLELLKNFLTPTQETEKKVTPKRKPGRPQGSVRVADRNKAICEAWASGNYPTKKELAAAYDVTHCLARKVTQGVKKNMSRA